MNFNLTDNSKMKMTFRLTYSILIAGFAVLVFTSCGGGTKKGSAADEVAFENQKISEDINKLISDLPSPTEVPYMLKATGEDFTPGLVNSLDKLDNYTTNEDESALNLGVYATDIGYLVSYEKVDDAIAYTEACQKLAESLGVASVFDVSTMERFQDNLDNPDSINSLVSESIIGIGDRLQSADRIPTAALVLSGSFVEGLYLAVKVIEEYPTDVLDEDTRNLILEPMVRVVLDQEKPLMDVIAMLKDLPQDDIIARMITELNILKILYDGDLAEIEEKIASNEGDFVLTQDMLADITTEVKRIRGDIVDYQ